MALLVEKTTSGREYLSYTEGLDGRPDLIVNNDGDTTLLIHEGVKAEELFEKTNELLDPNFTDNTLFQIVLTIIKDELKTDPTRYRKMKSISLGFLRKPPLELRGSIRYIHNVDIFIQESDLLLTPFDESIDTRVKLAYALARQWFGVYITPEAPNDGNLSEDILISGSWMDLLVS
ncbi:hypothetical protein JHK85_000724 [Glycine max]|nr:hypothetical protein JHK85_000724 [Glycine max]KAG5088092.1 hypothetical protein JHK86_000704 [Glycine max]